MPEIPDHVLWPMVFIWIAGCLCSIAVLTHKAGWNQWEDDKSGDGAGLLGGITKLLD